MTDKLRKDGQKEDIFLRVYVEPVRQGHTIAKVGPKLYGVLIAIAAYMDNKGQCYPGQETLANVCGCSRKTMNKYIKQLLEIKLDDGNPVLTREWENYSSGIRPVYTINPNAGIGIFDFKPEVGNTGLHSGKNGGVGNMGSQPYDNADNNDNDQNCPRVGNTGLQPHDNSDLNPAQSSQGLGTRSYKGVGNTGLQRVGNMGLHEEEPCKNNHTKEEPNKNNNITFGNDADPNPDKDIVGNYKRDKGEGNNCKNLKDFNTSKDVQNGLNVNTSKDANNSQGNFEGSNKGIEGSNKEVEGSKGKEGSAAPVKANESGEINCILKGACNANCSHECKGYKKANEELTAANVTEAITADNLAERLPAKARPEAIETIKEYCSNILANVESGKSLCLYGIFSEYKARNDDRTIKAHEVINNVLMTEYIKAKLTRCLKGEETPGDNLGIIIDTFNCTSEMWEQTPFLILACGRVTFVEETKEIIEGRKERGLPTIVTIIEDKHKFEDNIDGVELFDSFAY